MRIVQATILFDGKADDPWELSILCEKGVREHSRRTWDTPRRFKDLMSLTGYMITYPESKGGK